MEYNFVFSMDYGIGLILNETDGKYKIKYENQTLDDQSQFSFQFIDSRMSKYILNKKYETFFKYDYFYRGQDYANRGYVKSFLIVADTIVSRVSGSGDARYTQNIKYEQGHFINTCSCPVGKSCKHVAATVIRISNIMNELLNDTNLNQNNNLINLLEAFKTAHGQAEQLMLAISLKDAIKQERDIEEIIGFIALNRRRYNLDMLSYLLAYNNRLYQIVYNMPYDRERDKYYIDIKYTRSEIERIINDSDEYRFSYITKRKKLIYLVLNEEYYYSIKYILENPVELKIYNKILASLSSYVDPTPELVDLFLENYSYNFNYDDNLSQFVKNILKNANLDIKMRVYEKLGADLDLTIEDINAFPYDMQLKLIKSFRNSNTAINYINSHFDEFLRIDRYDLVCALYELFKFTTKNNEKLIIELLSKIENTKYVIAILKNETSTRGFYNNFDVDEFLEYIRIRYVISTFDKDLIVHFEFLISNNIVLEVDLKDRTVISITYKGLVMERNSNELNEILDKIFESPDFIAEYKKEEDKVKEKRNRAKILEYSKKINELNNILNYESYNQTGLVTLKPELTFFPYHQDEYAEYNPELSLELKIGRDKFYVIKSLPDLLDNIRLNNDYKYGKNLEFNHHINNFDNKSRDLIELLFLIEGKTDYRRYENPRYVPINGFVVERLFDIYRDNKLSINNIEYYISNEEIPFESKIDSNYLLTTNIDSDDVLFTTKNIYYLNKNNQTLYKIITNDNNIQLYDFIIKNNGMDVSLVLDKFKNDIFSRFSNEIVVAKNIEDDFKLSELIIDAYFDFDGKAITINTKIYKENETDFKMNVSDNTKLDRFSKYINNLGFVDNKIVDEDHIYNFLIMDFNELRGLANVYLSDSLKNKTMSKPTLGNIRITYTNTVMNAFLEESMYSEEELYQILSAVKKRKKFVLLKDDRIVDLNNDESVEFYDTVSDLKLDLKHVLTKKQIPTYQVIKALSHQNNCDIDEYVSNLIDELTKFKDAKYDIPKINGKLRGYQKEGFNFLKILSKYNLGGILADDMGLGKTLEIITLLLSDDKELPSLVVCPKSLIFNWLNEFEKFDGNTKVVCLIGNQNERHKIEESIENKKVVYIIGYNTLSNDLEYLSNVNFNYIILDEAQYIKNVSANKTKSVKQLEGIHKFALTGTPIENNILDLWSIFDFIMPDYLDSIDNFRSKYLGNDKYIDMVRIKVSPFILRRKKEDVLKDLPPKIERIISVDMTNTQRKLYDAYKLEANKAMEVGNGAFEMLPYITRLRQICVDPSTYLENYTGGSGKTSEVLDTIDNYIDNGHRILLFSSFVQALKIIEVNLINKNIKYYKITGDTDSKERLDLVDSFNKNDSIKVFLISLKAGGTGLNLVGADTVIHLDPWWNVSAENQATDRAHRIGQTKSVEVIKIVCEESIEQRVIELQNIKKDLVDRVIAKDDSSITGFTLEDINYILR